jgi:hypothetical protein
MGFGGLQVVLGNQAETASRKWRSDRAASSLLRIATDDRDSSHAKSRQSGGTLV